MTSTIREGVGQCEQEASFPKYLSKNFDLMKNIKEQKWIFAGKICLINNIACIKVDYCISIHAPLILHNAHKNRLQGRLRIYTWASNLMGVLFMCFDRQKLHKIVFSSYKIIRYDLFKRIYDVCVLFYGNKNKSFYRWHRFFLQTSVYRIVSRNFFLICNVIKYNTYVDNTRILISPRYIIR